MLPRVTGRTAAACLLASALLGGDAAAQLAAERVGEVAQLPDEMGTHWVWASDSVLRRSALFDADTGRMLGMVDGGEGVSPLHPHVSRARGEVYVVETVYSRGHRGERTDLVTIYDAATLAVMGEVVIPPRRADNGNGVALAALLDGDRFLVVLNQDPGTSVSVVDLEARVFVAELATPGCALVLPAGERRFGMLCGDGTAQSITLDESGREAGRARSAPFFDATSDPLTEKGVRAGPPGEPGGALWHFASFEGFLHTLDFGGEAPVAAERWSLFSDAERAEGWRIGGLQHLAFHAPSGRLYSVAHRGEPGSHKDAGPEVWVYDVAARARVQRIELANLTAAFLRPRIGVEAGSFPDRVLSALLPNPGADTLAVTRDAAPLLLAGERESGAVGVYDATTGEHLRDLEETGIGGGLLVVP
jgi:methylamine dehydrogenase heavy chain